MKINLPHLLTQKNKYIIGIAGLTFSTSLYSFTNQIQFFHAQNLPYGPVNKMIPFIPESIWIYLTHSILFISAYLYAKDIKNLNKYFYAFLTMQLITCGIFLIFPTTFPRENYPLLAENMDAWTYLVFKMARLLDTPANCFPSQHVASVYLASFLFLEDRKNAFPFFFIWATLISITTLTTKQHYLADIPSGLLVAVFCYWLFFKKIKYIEPRH